MISSQLQQFIEEDGLIPIGFLNATFHPLSPLNQGGANREYVSNSNPIGINPDCIGRALSTFRKAKNG